MMKLVYSFYEGGVLALKRGADINDIVKMKTRERIGRYKYTTGDDVQKEFDKISMELAQEFADISGKEAR